MRTSDITSSVGVAVSVRGNVTFFPEALAVTNISGSRESNGSVSVSTSTNNCAIPGGVTGYILPYDATDKIAYTYPEYGAISATGSALARVTGGT